MNKYLPLLIVLYLATIAGCSYIPKDIATPIGTSQLVTVTPTVTKQFNSDMHPNPMTSPSPTLDIGDIFELTISIRDKNFHSHVYSIKVGCLDAMPCVTDSRLLFNEAFPVGEMSWSPDGQLLTFDGISNNSSDIFVAGDEGKTIVNITSSPALNERSPAWSPDGAYIAYSVRSSSEASRILVSLPDGVDSKQIFKDVFEPIQFVWSHQGMMAYSAFVSTNDGRYQIRVLNNDSSLYWTIPLDESKMGFGTASPEFSPDDQWLIYTGAWLNNTRVYLADLQAKIVTDLFPVDKNCSDFKPSWSPNGEWFAFISNCESDRSQQYDLYLTNLTQRQRLKLDLGIEGDIQDVTWRPLDK